MNNERNFLKNKQHTLNEFHFKNDYVIKDAVVDYAYIGTPKYDDKGNIINAIVFCHGFDGDYSSISDFYQLIGDKRIFTKEDNFFISITALGFPQSCSPSTTGLKYNFPNYEIEDLIHFEKQFLNEVFPKIKKLKGIIGFSFGGYIALGWSVLYPDDMDFIIHFVSSYKTSSYKYIYAKLANNIIESSPHFYSDVYDESMSNVLISLSQLQFLISYSNTYLNSIDIDEVMFMMNQFEEKGLFLDVYDIKFRNDFLMSYDLEDKLDQIKCKLLIIGAENNNYFIPEFDSKPLNDAVDGSKFILLDVGYNPNGLEHIHKMYDKIKVFLEDKK